MSEEDRVMELPFQQGTPETSALLVYAQFDTVTTAMAVGYAANNMMVDTRDELLKEITKLLDSRHSKRDNTLTPHNILRRALGPVSLFLIQTDHAIIISTLQYEKPVNYMPKVRYSRRCKCNTLILIFRFFFSFWPTTLLAPI